MLFLEDGNEVPLPARRLQQLESEEDQSSKVKAAGECTYHANPPPDKPLCRDQHCTKPGVLAVIQEPTDSRGLSSSRARRTKSQCASA